MKKGQAALEFLTTYGWAFLVILIMIGALVYFGVLNPSKVLPDKCILETGFNCRDHMITVNRFNVSVENKMGGGLRAVNITEVYSDRATINIANCGPKDEVVLVDGRFNIECSGFDMSASEGDKADIKFTVSYIEAKGTYAKSFEGSIYGTVQ